MLFEGWHLRRIPESWPYHPFHQNNNINGADVDAKGNSIRWTINFGERGMRNRNHAFSVFLSKPIFHVNKRLEVWNSYDGVVEYYATLAFARFNLEWLTDRKEHLQTVN
jgi:hypothetical protein